MTDNTVAVPPADLVQFIELRTRFAPEEKPRASMSEPEAAVVSDAKDFLDPAADRRATASLFWALENGEPMEIPFRDPEELFDALACEYEIGGPDAVDRLVSQIDRALILIMAQYPDDPAIPPQVFDPLQPRPIAIPRNLYSTHQALIGRVPRDMGLVDFSGPRAWTDDIVVQLTPFTYKKLLLSAEAAVTRALDSLRAESADALLRVEETARGLLAMTLDGARNDIFEEALRYFKFQRESVEAALEHYKHPMAKAREGARAARATEVAHMPVHEVPMRLQKGLKELKPLAETAIKAKDAIDPQILASWLIGRNAVQEARKVEQAVEVYEAAAQKLAIAVAKTGEAHPVVLRMTPEEMVKAESASREFLGAILFPILARAYKANRKVRASLKEWPVLSRETSDAWPEHFLFDRLKADCSLGSVWRHRKYVERALDHCFPDPADGGRAAPERVLARLYGGGVAWEEIGAALCRDLIAFKAAEVIDKASEKAATEVAGAFVRRIPRLVPVLNWLYAGWGIYTSISEFGGQHDFHYCTLDPGDALVDQAPSLAGLTGSVAWEMLCAFI